MNSIKEYFESAVHELRQVQWPTQKHAVKISIITGVFVLSSAVLLASTDYILNEILLFAHEPEQNNILEQLQQQNPEIDLSNIQFETESGGEVNIINEGGEGGGITIQEEPDTEAVPQDNADIPVTDATNE